MILDLIRRRVVLVAGKGGVGRTTAVAALAAAAGRLGRRTLLVEVKEPAMPEASPLARLFGLDHLPHSPRKIAEGVEGVLLQCERGTELFLASVLPVRALAHLAMRSQALLRLLHAGPSFYELGLFYHLLSLVRSVDSHGRPHHETIFFDMPATGHALAMTELPDVLLRLVPRGPIAAAMREGQAIMNDPAHAAAVVVTLAEALPVTESLELIAGLRRTNVPVAGVIANRLSRDPFTEAERGPLEDLLRGRAVLGASEVDRRRRVEESLARIRRSVDVPILGFDEQPHAEGRAVVDAIADRLVADAAAASGGEAA